MFKIITFQQKYRDDMIFCLLSAKDALGRIPRLNEDLLDIQTAYFDKGDMFWIALNDSERVVGMIGTDTISESDMWLKRLYVKPDFKRNGVGSALLAVAEEYASSKGVKTINTRFAEDFTEAAKFYPTKGFVKIGEKDGISHFVKQR